MYCDELYPITVSKYEPAILIDVIRHITGTTERSEISVKGQVDYLCKYLDEKEHVNAKTILVENEYVDRYYLEDYSRYYSRCFNHVPKKCARIHFFSNEFNELAFTKALESNDQATISLLQQSYLGFVVIRPIPDTFIGRLCLKPYKSLIKTTHQKSSSEYKLITTKQKAHLFGLELFVDTTPFIEQDTVVSECATSVIWTILSSGLGSASADYLPSLSTVTEIASSGNADGSKTFPNGGLTYQQVCVALKYYDLEPNVLPYSSLDDLKELIYAYVSSDIPIIVGGEILAELSPHSEAASHISKGRHFVSILGYHCDSNVDNGFLPHNIDKVYIHDDRIGPFVRLNLKESKTARVLSHKDEVNHLLELSLYGKSPQLIKPEIIIIGLYHKIRLPYETIKNFFVSFCSHLDNLGKVRIPQLRSAHNTSSAGAREKLELSKHFKKLEETIEALLNESNWEITLSNNVSIKKALSSNSNFYTFNGSNEKSYFLIKSLPKYIWRIRFNKLGTEIVDILLDATSVPQSDTIIGVITYRKDVDNLCRYIEENIKDWRKFEFSNHSEVYKNNIKPLFRFYSNLANRSDLNAKYGPLTHPRRSPKKDETDDIGNYVVRSDLYKIDESFDFKRLDEYKSATPSTRLIWVITQGGDMIVGEDVKVEDSFAGHPTLTNGKAARVAGELIYSKQLDKWVINLESGTYCSHLDKSSAKVNEYLNSVIKFKLFNLNKSIVNFYALSSEEAGKYNKEFPKDLRRPL